MVLGDRPDPVDGRFDPGSTATDGIDGSVPIHVLVSEEFGVAVDDGRCVQHLVTEKSVDEP